MIYDRDFSLRALDLYYSEKQKKIELKYITMTGPCMLSSAYVLPTIFDSSQDKFLVQKHQKLSTHIEKLLSIRAETNNKQRE